MVVPDNMHTAELVVYNKISENLKILPGHLFAPYLLVKKISEIFYQRCIKDPVQHLLCSFCAIIVSQNLSQKCSFIIVYKRSKYAFVHGKSKEFIEY